MSESNGTVFLDADRAVSAAAGYAEAADALRGIAESIGGSFDPSWTGRPCSDAGARIAAGIESAAEVTRRLSAASADLGLAVRTAVTAVSDVDASTARALRSVDR